MCFVGWLFRAWCEAAGAHSVPKVCPGTRLGPCEIAVHLALDGSRLRLAVEGGTTFRHGTPTRMFRAAGADELSRVPVFGTLVLSSREVFIYPSWGGRNRDSSTLAR